MRAVARSPSRRIAGIACMSKLLTADQLAERIERPVRTLERWRLTGQGPAFVRLGRRIAYREADVEAWLASRTYPSRAAELAQRTAGE